MTVCKPRRELSLDTKSASTLSGTSHPLELQEINVSCLNHPVYGIFVIPAQTNYTDIERQLQEVKSE